MAETVETAVYRLRVEGQEQLGKLKSDLDGITVAEEKAQGATRATTAALERRLANLDPVIKAQERYRKELEAATRFAQAGVGTEAQRTAQIEAATQRYNASIQAIQKAEQATQKYGASLGLARHELINLGRQVQDVVVSLQGGQGLGTVFLQQGSQILDVLGTSQGGIRGALAGLGTSLRSVLTVGRLAFAGIAAGAAGAALATSDYLSEQKEVERALIGAGRRSATSGDINRIGDERSSLTGLSISETRQAAVEFAKTGQIHSRVIGEMIETTKNFALVTGQSSKDAAAALAGAFTNMDGIDKLNRQFNFLDANSRQWIENLLLAGRTTEAAAATNERLRSVLKDVEGTQGALEKGWTAIGNAISNATSRLGEYIAKAAGIQGKSRGDRAFDIATDIEERQSRIDRGDYNNLIGDTTQLDKAKAAIEELRNKLRALYNEMAAGDKQATFNALSISAQRAVAAVDPLKGKLDQAVGALGQLKAAQDAGINVPGLQMAVTYYTQIAEQIQRQAAAQDVLMAKYPGMTAEFAKQVEALKDQNDLLRARQNGTEATVSAAIAYKNAIAAGANETEAAAIKAETLKGHLLQAASAADQLSSIQLDWTDADNYDRASMSNDPNVIAGGNSGSYNRRGLQMGAGNSGRSDFEVNANPFQWWSGSWTDPELLPAGAATRAAMQADDRARAPIRERHAQIVEDLRKSIEEQTKATEENTNAITVGLNPLYTQGRGSAIEFGYMHAAKGLDFVAQGPPSGDQIPVHLKVNGGERVTVTPAGQVSNDNSKSNVVNATINIVGSQSTSRRSSRQLAQKYASMLAALS